MNSTKGNETPAADGSASRIILKKEPRLDAKRQAFSYQIEAFEAVRDRTYAAFHEQGFGKTKLPLT